MERSNLTLKSNIYPWHGRWSDNDAEFIAKIWDESALGVLIAEERKKACVLTPHQREIYEHSIHCPRLEPGDNPFGWILDHGDLRNVCYCRNEMCPHFKECRGKSNRVIAAELARWSQGERSGLEEFDADWNLKKDSEVPKVHDIDDIIQVFQKGEYCTLSSNPDQKESDPLAIVGFPGEEKFESYDFMKKI